MLLQKVFSGSAKGTLEIALESKIGGATNEIELQSVAGEDSQNQRWPFVAELIDDHTLQLGVIGTANGTIYWPHQITFALSGTVHLVPTAQKKADVAAANKKILADKVAATRKNTCVLEINEQMFGFYSTFHSDALGDFVSYLASIHKLERWCFSQNKRRY